MVMAIPDLMNKAELASSVPLAPVGTTHIIIIGSH
jgi:hypothetical protein